MSTFLSAVVLFLALLRCLENEAPRRLEPIEARITSEDRSMATKKIGARVPSRKATSKGARAADRALRFMSKADIEAPLRVHCLAAFKKSTGVTWDATCEARAADLRARLYPVESVAPRELPTIRNLKRALDAAIDAVERSDGNNADERFREWIKREIAPLHDRWIRELKTFEPGSPLSSLVFHIDGERFFGVRRPATDRELALAVILIAGAPDAPPANYRTGLVHRSERDGTTLADAVIFVQNQVFKSRKRHGLDLKRKARAILQDIRRAIDPMADVRELLDPMGEIRAARRPVDSSSAVGGLREYRDALPPPEAESEPHDSPD